MNDEISLFISTYLPENEKKSQQTVKLIPKTNKSPDLTFCTSVEIRGLEDADSETRPKLRCLGLGNMCFYGKF